jgi:hypothetical protein
MNKLYEYLENLYERPLKIVTNGKGCTIQATERNALKKEIIQVFKGFLTEMGIECYQTNEGIIIAIQNRAVEEENEEGVISVELGMKIKNLDYCPSFEETDYNERQAEKQAEKEKRELAKKEKIEKDKKLREEMKALKALRD